MRPLISSNILTSAEAQQAILLISVAIPVVKGGEVGMTDPLMIELQQSLCELRSTSSCTMIRHCRLRWVPSSTTALRACLLAP